MTTENSTTSAPVSPDAAAAEFDATTARWGRLTMLVGLFFSLAGPLYLVTLGGLEVTQAQFWTAFAAVAGTFFVIWLVEPLTYYPILGQAAMYQAFMIGNISSKLLPAALIAQANIDAKPGTKRAELAACLAICGAAVMHLLSLFVFVGVLGTWLISVVPSGVIDVTRLYVLPSVLGAVLVQAIVSMKAPRPTIIALVVAAVVVFGIVPLVPSLALAATAIVVLVTILLGWLLREKPGPGSPYGSAEPAPTDRP